MPETGAGPVRVTVPVEVVGPATVGGFRLTEASTGVEIANVAV
jgi:hypothetical protein